MITIIFGKPGVGKTAYMVANALEYLGMTEQSRQLHRYTCSKISSIGGKYTMPAKPPVYTNFPVTVQCGYRKYRSSYYIDGFHLGFDNPFVPVVAVAPGSKIYLTEAQRYYNSRLSTEFPDWSSRYFEEHRHYGLDIMLDVQRPGLIDLNIRELCEQFVEVVGLEHDRDYAGNILASRFVLRCWSDWKYVDAYLSSSAEKYDEFEYIYEGNVFRSYRSESYFNNFLPAEDYDYLEHIDFVGADIDFSKLIYRQTAPYGFYKSEAREITKARRKNGDIAGVT